MKKILVTVLIIMAVIGCGGGEDKQALLNELKEERRELDARIAELQRELSADSTVAISTVERAVKMQQVNPGLFQHYVQVQGAVESDNNILMPARAPGVVQRIYVNEGQIVKKGQLLAELDGAVLESTIKELETNLELARTVFERQQRLWEKNIGSEVQYLQAKTNKESLEQRLQTTREQYRLTKFYAPIDGSIDKVLIKENEAIASGMGAIRIVQMSDLKISANLSEVYQEKVAAGDSVEIEIPVAGLRFTSTISAVSKVIDPKDRTFFIDVDLSQKHAESLRPNMLARLLVKDYANPDAITVPINSVQKTDGNPFLFVVMPEGQGGVVEKRIVQTGLFYSNRFEILDGLSAGEFIVVAGHQDLSDGQTVKLANAAK